MILFRTVWMICWIIAGVVYGLSFVYTETLWWIMLFWPCMVWRLGISHKVTNIGGFMWALLATGIQISGMMYGVYSLTVGQSFIRVIFIMMWVALMALPGAVWFGLMGFVHDPVCKKCNLAWWGLSTWLYFLWMEYACLLVCGTWGGCSLLSPLISLSNTRFIMFLPFVGRSLYLAFWLGINAFFFFTWMVRARLLFLIGFCIIAVIGRFIGPRQENIPSWISHIGVLRSCFLLEEGPDGSLIHCAQHAQRLYDENGTIRCIIMPESSFYHPAVIERWHHLVQGTWLHNMPCGLIVGGYHLVSGGYYNTAAFIEGDCVKALYYKCHAAPFIERIPWMFRVGCIKKLFNKTQGELVIGNVTRPVWEILPDIRVVPYICSELFCAAQQLDDNQNFPILALCNTRWAPPSMKKLMVAGARLRAIEWRREILFIAQDDACWIGMHGEMKNLITELEYC